ncbi:hypothetical protein HN51_066481 [Arachis hypogaea]
MPRASCISAYWDVGKIPALFCRSFKDVISNSLLFIDANGDEIKITIQKGDRTAIIVQGYKQLLERYHLDHGGWLKVKYVGRDKFLIDQAMDHNMHVVSNYVVPFKSLLDNKKLFVHENNVDSTAYAFELMDGGLYVPLIDIAPAFPTDLPGDMIESIDQPSSENVLSMPSILSNEVPDVPKTPFNVNISHFTPCVDEVYENNSVSLEGIHVVLDHLEVSIANNNSNPLSGNHFSSIKSDVTPLVYSIVKVVTPYQADHYAMLLPAKFATKAFPSKLNKIKVKQSNGSFCEMKLRWNSERPNGVFITKGWSRYCKRNKLKGGSVVKFSVSSIDETVMSISILSR